MWGGGMKGIKACAVLRVGARFPDRRKPALLADAHRKTSLILRNREGREGDQEMLFDMPSRSNDLCTVDLGQWLPQYRERRKHFLMLASARRASQKHDAPCPLWARGDRTSYDFLSLYAVYCLLFSLVRLPQKRGDAAGRSWNVGGAVFTDTGDRASGTDQTCRMTVSHDDPDS